MPNHESMDDGQRFEHLVDLASGAQVPDAPDPKDASGTSTKIVGALRGILDSLRVSGEPEESSILRASSMPGSLASRLGLDKLGVGLAQLVGDTRGVVLAGYRGAATTYALTFTTDGVEIHLEVLPSEYDGDKAEIQAHIDTGDDETNDVTVRFHKTSDSTEVSTAQLDDGGYLTVSLPLGTYDMLIELESRSVLVPAVEIG